MNLRQKEVGRGERSNSVNFARENLLPSLFWVDAPFTSVLPNGERWPLVLIHPPTESRIWIKKNGIIKILPKN